MFIRRIRSRATQRAASYHSRSVAAAGGGRHLEILSLFGAGPARRSALSSALSGWWPPLLLLVLPVLLFRQGLGTGTPPFGGDVVVLNYPLLALIKRQLAQGLLPLWNNYAGGGYPLVPFSALIFYPPLWGLRLLSVNDAITLLDVAHFALAGVGAYMLAGITGASRTGRTIGALGFVLSGFLIGHLYAGHLFELGVVAWMPWVFYAAHRLIRGPGPRAAVFLGAMAGLQVLADGLGFLVFTVYPVAIVLALGLIVHLRRRATDSLRLLGLLALSGLVALGLSAVLVLPFAQVLGHSIRAGGLDYTGASKISLPPAALLMAFAPDAVGNGLENTYWLDDFSLGYWHEFALYVGLLPLLAALVACVWCRRAPWVRFYAGLALVGLLLAFGRYTPIYGLAFRLPGLDLVRVPARWLLVSILGVAVLSGCGVDWLLAQRAGARAMLRGLRVPLLGLLTLFVVVVIGLQVVYMQGGYAGIQPHFAETVEPAASRMFLFGGLLALVLACHAERLIRPAATAALLLAITLLDLWVADSGSVRFLDPGQFYRPSTVSSLLQTDGSTNRVLTIDRSMPNRQGMVDGVHYDAEDFAPVTLQPYWSVTHPQAFGGAYEISNADARDLITCYDPRFADLVGISEVTFAAPFSHIRLCVPGTRKVTLTLRTAVATEYWLLPNGTSWNPTPFLGVTYVYRNPTALPRSFLVPLAAARTVATPLAQRLAVMANSFDGRRDLVLDPHISRAPLGLGFLQDAWAGFLRPAPTRMPTLQPGETRVLADTSNSVQVAIDAREPSYLVLDDAYYPGWQVTIDGKAAPLLKADYLLRAVKVPAGSHLLTFVYAPLSYLVGMLISLASAVLVLGYLAWPVWAPARRRVLRALRPMRFAARGSGALARPASSASRGDAALPSLGPGREG